MFLLDTNIVSELRKAGKSTCNQGVWKWQSMTDPLDCYVSVMTLFEIQYGILKLKRHDQRQADILNDWFERQVLESFRHRILPIDMDVASTCASLHIPDKKPDRDAFIAATAIEHQFTLVTRNIKDFSGLDLDVLNPWG